MVTRFFRFFAIFSLVFSVLLVLQVNADVLIGNEVAKPVVLSVSVPRTIVGQTSKVLATIRNEGDTASVQVVALTGQGNYIFPPSQTVTFDNGETKSVSFDLSGQIAGTETVKITACGVSQFTAPTCSSGTGSGEIISANSDNESKSGSNNGGLLSLIGGIIIVLLLVIIYLQFFRKKR